MHEFVLAEGIISTVVKTAEKEGLKEITKIKIKIGELQQIDIEMFEFALKKFIQPENPILKMAKIEFEKEKAILKCRACEHEWTFEDAIKKLNKDEVEALHLAPEEAHTYVRCSKCKSSNFEVLKGNRVWIDSIEGKT
ncbi:MAG: hydrogenase nickel incorporation protein HypA [Elusimicrobiota bacterium]|nr:hydrogenase nickel incorporation protein HypA [Elusimicrobiota bacterium]